jgi:hypothetical protein
LGGQSADSQLKGLRLSITCDMFRGEDIRLPVDTPNDPRPVPRRKYSPDEALALAREQGYQAFELFDWREPIEWNGYLAAKQKYRLACACIEANKGVRAPGCGLTNPAEREARRAVTAIEVARRSNRMLLV